MCRYFHGAHFYSCRSKPPHPPEFICCARLLLLWRRFFVCHYTHGKEVFGLKRVLTLLLVVAILGISLAACAPAEKSANTTDRSNNAILVPDKVEKIVSMAAATTRILVDLGLGDKLVAVDTYSALNLPAEQSASIVQLDMMAPDLEQLSALQPDILFVSELSSAGQEDIYASLREAGVCVAEIPTPSTVDGVFEDVLFIANCTGKSAEGEKIVTEARARLEKIAQMLEGVEERPKVYYEVSPAPDCYTTGTGTYMNELIELAGGVNIFAEQEGWLAVSEETIVSAQPDVIFTGVDFLPDPVGDIKDRAAWKELPALRNDKVVFIDPQDSQQPTHHIVDAIEIMLEVLHPYPELAT